MSKGNNSPGLSHLAAVLKAFNEKRQDNSLIIDFGSIESDGSLLTNTFTASIPKSDYVVCRHLQKFEETTESRSVGDHGSHTHKVEITRPLKTGDRVLVAWVQNDPVVIDVIVQADSIL